MCQVKSRGKVKLMRPMGNVMVIYYRVDQQWKRAGTLCLHCLLFEPDTTHPQQKSINPQPNNRTSRRRSRQSMDPS